MARRFLVGAFVCVALWCAVCLPERVVATSDAVAGKDADAPAATASEASGAKEAKKKAAKKAAKKKKKEKPVEIVDLLLDVADSMCMKLGKLVKRKKFSAEKRCDLLKFCIEDLAGMFDGMANELEIPQQEFVDNALQMHHWMNLQMNMKNVVKLALAAQKPSEESISAELNKLMSQWVLNVATGQSAKSGNSIGQMSREALKNLRAMGIGLPSFGGNDDDAMDEETALLGEDYQWAEASKKQAQMNADEYDEDDDDDDDDEL